ncbi:MAG TPA: hypothetical protein DDY70_01605, partial [Clostridiales bacterium]|nr:hypothetical protein [Clostridiales bacterium]
FPYGNTGKFSIVRYCRFGGVMRGAKVELFYIGNFPCFAHKFSLKRVPIPFWFPYGNTGKFSIVLPRRFCGVQEEDYG